MARLRRMRRQQRPGHVPAHLVCELCGAPCDDWLDRCGCGGVFCDRCPEREDVIEAELERLEQHFIATGELPPPPWNKHLRTDHHQVAVSA